MKLSDKIADTAAAPTGTGSAEGPVRTVRRRTATRRVRRDDGPADRSDARQTAWVEAKRTVRALVLDEITPRLTGADAIAEGDVVAEVEAAVDRALRREDIDVSPAERRRFIAELRADLLGHGPLEPLLHDPEITEVMCNSHDEIWIERNGRVEKTDVRFADEAQYRQVIERIVTGVGRRVDESSPMVDARLPDGSRVNVILPPLALRGPSLTIRRFSDDPYTVQDLINFGSLSQELALFLEACVAAECNVLVSGGTASGKTTLLNVLSRFIPEHERIITIEDSAELRLQQPHVVPLETRPANSEGAGQVAIRDLVRNALRMRPDRIVVGECRGGEALDMLQAMNTGHDGSLTTVHANSPRDALSRLETLVLMGELDLPQRAIREQIAAAIDIIVQVERLPDGHRKVVSVQEIQGMEDTTVLLQEVFAYEPRVSEERYVGHAEPTGLRPRIVERFKQRDVELPLHVFRRG